MPIRVSKKWNTLAAGMVLFTLVGTPAFAATDGSTTSPPSLVALGDSITFGYNLVPGNLKPAPMAFPFLMAKALHATALDLGIPGYQSANLVTQLSEQSVQTALHQATYVTIDIGSNDILAPAVQDGLLSPTHPVTIITTKEEAQFVQAETHFAENLAVILAKVKQEAPTAKVVLYNIYNPIPPADKALRLISNSLVRRENATIATEAKLFDLPVADAYNAFENKTTAYVRAGDVHPNALGQQVLANVGLSALATNTTSATSSGSTGTGSSGSTSTPAVPTIPASWHLTVAEKTALEEVLTSGVSTPYVQEVSQTVEKVSPVLLPKAKVTSTIKALLASFGGLTKSMMQVTEQRTASTTSALITMTQTTNQLTRKILEYLNGTNLYLNQGSGWTLASNSTNVQALLQAARNSTISFQALDHVTAVPAGKGFIFHATYNSQMLSSYVQKIVQSMGQTNQTTNSLIATMIKRMHVAVQFTVVQDNKQYVLTQENAHITMNLPKSMMQSTMGAGTSLGVVANVLEGMNLDEIVNSTLSYDVVAVTVPSGLPSLPPSTTTVKN